MTERMAHRRLLRTMVLDEPDLSRQAISDGIWDNTTLRLTWQATPRNKLTAFWDEQHMCRNCWGGGSATVSPEAQDGLQNVNDDTSWRQPNAILDARFAKVSAQVDF
ncbi:MAG: hypothetical protein ABI868_04940 [Acidobacteriota bacterium]